MLHFGRRVKEEGSAPDTSSKDTQHSTSPGKLSYHHSPFDVHHVHILMSVFELADECVFPAGLHHRSRHISRLWGIHFKGIEDSPAQLLFGGDINGWHKEKVDSKS